MSLRPPIRLGLTDSLPSFDDGIGQPVAKLQEKHHGGKESVPRPESPME